MLWEDFLMDLAITLGLAVFAFIAGFMEGTLMERRRLARLITLYTPKDADVRACQPEGVRSGR